MNKGKNISDNTGTQPADQPAKRGPGRPKGIPKTGGKKKGTGNKDMKPLRDRINAFMESTFDDVLEAWETLDPLAKVNFYKDLLKYSIPTLQSVSLDAVVKKEHTVEDELDELAKEE
jgi:hypothetical protein